MPRRCDAMLRGGRSLRERDPDTLVIVAADHETGSLAIEDTNEVQDDPDYPNESGEGRTAEDGPFPVAGSDKEFLVDWTTANHTAEDVPVTAMGQGGESLVGVYENTHIHDAMLDALGLADVVPPVPDAPGAQRMPDTGGPVLEPWLVVVAPAAALLAALCVLGLFISRRALRGSRDGGGG